MKQKFGVHASIAGGLHNALLIGHTLGCDCLQIFVKNQRQWSAPPLRDEQVEAWQAARWQNPCGPVVAHGTYLVNLAARDRGIRSKSVSACVDEVRRCQALGVGALIIHPGSHNGDGQARGIRRVIASLKEVLDRTGGCGTQVLLETTAGQGSCLGHRFEHLSAMIEGAGADARVGVCLDTCHLHAAGYDLATAGGHGRMVADLVRCMPIERVRCIHANDSVREAGSRVDRHAHIGMGTIGRNGFRRLLRDGRFLHVPRILETPKELAPDGREYDAVNLETLRRLSGSAAGPGRSACPPGRPRGDRPGGSRS